MSWPTTSAVRAPRAFRDKQSDYALPVLIEDMAAVITEVSPDAPVHLVGHDWGSIQGWEAVTWDAPRRADRELHFHFGPAARSCRLVGAPAPYRAARRPARSRCAKQRIRGTSRLFHLPLLPELVTGGVRAQRRLSDALRRWGRAPVSRRLRRRGAIDFVTRIGALSRQRASTIPPSQSQAHRNAGADHRSHGGPLRHPCPSRWPGGLVVDGVAARVGCRPLDHPHPPRRGRRHGCARSSPLSRTGPEANSHLGSCPGSAADAR